MLNVRVRLKNMLCTQHFPENRSILFNNQSIRDDIHNVGSLMADKHV